MLVLLVQLEIGEHGKDRRRDNVTVSSCFFAIRYLLVEMLTFSVAKGTDTWSYIQFC